MPRNVLAGYSIEELALKLVIMTELRAGEDGPAPAKIYNARELRDELLRRFPYQSGSRLAEDFVNEELEKARKIYQMTG